MNIVILCGSYDPKPSAVGICAKNLAEEFKKMGHKVTIVLPYDGFNSADNNIIRFREPDYIRYHSDSKFNRLYVRIKRYLQAFIKKCNINQQAINGYTKVLYRLHSLNPIDLILPFSFPIESIISAVQFCSNQDDKILINPVIFDNFVENVSLHRSSLNKRIKKRVHTKMLAHLFDYCDHLYVIHSQAEYFRRTFYDVISKVTFIEHPLLKPPKKIILTNGRMLYSGSFLKGYVKSKDFALLLRTVMSHLDCKIDFCIMGNDVLNIEELALQYPNNVCNYGRVPFSKAEDLISSSSILISVSELSGVQISSKIFTYMATGKPIVQFYYSDNDINKRLLEKYPLSHTFKLNGNNKYTSESINNLISFINSNLDQRISYQEVYASYPEASPHYLATSIIDENSKKIQ